jgi:competence protein ComEC
MKKLLRYIPIHFTFLLLLGIVVQFYGQIWTYGFKPLLFSGVFLLILLLLFRKSKAYYILVWTCFFYVGIALVYFHNDVNHPSFYQSHFKKESNAVLVIDKVLKPGQNHYKYQASIIEVDHVKTIGKVLLNVSKDSLQELLKVDDVIITKPILKEVTEPRNPHEFNYKAYVRKQGILHQIYLQPYEYYLLKEKRASLSGTASQIRTSIQKSLQKYPFEKEELAVIQALLLGQKQDISKELLTAYAKAGAMHILAISGLHVGILLLMLSFLLKPLERIKHGKIVKTVFLILLLWMFALIAGFSASVVRAVTMFTFLAIGMSVGRPNSVVYALISSAFVLLIFQPLLLFDVGFQLSYLAVFGIVWMQPKLYALWKPRNKILNRVWQLSTVSIAAQFGILPLSLFYFHQFPGLFILSNIVIIPFLGSILIIGIGIIICAQIGILTDQLVLLYGKIISSLNGFISFVSEQEEFLIRDISFSGTLLVASYAVLFGLGNLLSKRSVQNIFLLLWSIIFLQGVLLLELYQVNQKEALIVFHKSTESIIGIRHQDSLKVFRDAETLEAYPIKAYTIGEQVAIKDYDSIPSFFSLGAQHVVVVDREGIYEFNKLQNSIVVLRQSPKIHLEKLITQLQPKYIVADGSNYWSIVQKWKQTCIKNNTPFWHTAQNGAFILKEK